MRVCNGDRSGCPIVLIDGSVGVGKTTLGRAASERIGATFLDADAFRDRTRNWVGDARGVIERVAEACRNTSGSILVAHAIRARDFALYRIRLPDREVRCIGLLADLDSIEARTRALSPAELARAARMIAEGYGNRPFADAILRTDRQSFDASVTLLTEEFARISDQCRTTSGP